MKLDTYTLLVVLAMSTFLMAGAMWIAFAGRFREGLGPWTLALLMQGTGWVLLLIPNATEPATTAAATALFAMCWSLQMSALLQFLSLSTPRWLYYGPILIAFIGFVLHLQEPLERLYAAGIGFGLAYLATAFALLFDRGAIQQRARWLLASSFFVMSGGLFWLAFTAWFEPQAFRPISGLAPASGPSLLAFYAVTICSSYAFILMHKERADRQSYELATTDPLTGVYNRRTFKELAEPNLSRSRRSLQPVSLLMFDLDHFKRTNDTFGHLAGDDVLKAFSLLVRGCLRKEDILARYGGEEFVVLLPGTSRFAAAALAERIRQLVADQPLVAAGHPVRVTVSVGVASEGGDTLPSLESLLARADEALYKAKTEGRNRVATLDLPLTMQPAV